MRDAAAQSRNLLVLGIFVFLGGVTYLINGCTQKTVKIPVNLTESASISSSSSYSVFTDTGIFLLDSPSGFEILAHRNTGVGLLVAFLGLVLIVRAAELKKGKDRVFIPWKASAILLICTGIIPTFVAHEIDVSVLADYAPDLSVTWRQPLVFSLALVFLGVSLLRKKSR
ncbi:hypothetical protein [Timonella sp. A28]|uniref:hypothetical protein n=1 Tax=Timonella sp. A28 TaxID=3442640 RepID=UPI003EBD9CE8